MITSGKVVVLELVCVLAVGSEVKKRDTFSPEKGGQSTFPWPQNNALFSVFNSREVPHMQVTDGDNFCIFLQSPPDAI